MGAKRIGMALFGVGLFVGSITAVTGLVYTSTAAACPPNRDPKYSLVGFDFQYFGVVYSDGCNVMMTSPGVGVGLLLVVAGVLVGGVGIARDALAEP
ncbi:hypothetical protein [Halegenticoccus tardaugens]|uniref:hypothetical protein n=1 Tax=Halegenticoccus tardaugens TaxID=2071624 RepID=UPI00100A345D|nr:hypothetical protein [Halegenticoccus tardaugens]